MTQAVKTAQTLRLGRRMLLSQAGDTKAVLSVKEMKQTASDMLTTQDLCLGILTTARPIKRSVLITVLLFIQNKVVLIPCRKSQGWGCSTAVSTEFMLETEKLFTALKVLVMSQKSLFQMAAGQVGVPMME